MKATKQNQRPQSRSDLPNSLLPVKLVPLGTYNPVELERLARKPQPTTLAPEIRAGECFDRRQLTMAQHRGRTLEGNRISMGNLRRRVKVMVPAEAPTIPETMPKPLVPLAKPPVKVIDAVKTRYLKSVLSKEEYDLFILTWREWFEGHPEYTLPEDIHDVQTVCMETVQQYRIRMLEQRFPDRDLSPQFDQSFRRGQQARTNLAARRTDRIGAGANKNGTINIGNMNVAVMAGQVDQKKVIELQQRAKDQLAKDMMRLESANANMDDVIDVEVENAEIMPLSLPAPEPKEEP